RDYPLYYAALRDMPTWFQAHHLEHALGLLDEIRTLAPLTHAAALDHIRAKNHEEVDARRIVHAVRRHAHLLHNPESALWTTSPRVVFQAVDEPAEVDAAAARAELVRRYLRARDEGRRVRLVGPPRPRLRVGARRAADRSERGGSRSLRRSPGAVAGGR